MVAAEDVFRFVAIRDPQRSVRPGILLARAFDAAAPSRLHVSLEAARSREERASQADAYIAVPARFTASPPDRPSAPRYVGSLGDMALPLRVLDEALTDRADRLDGSEIAGFVRARWPPLLAPAAEDGDGVGDGPEGERREPPTLRALLNDPAVHGMWRDCADSMLATVYGSSPTPVARADLARALLLWELLDRLADDDRVERDRVADLLSTGLILTPTGDRTTPIRRTRAPEIGDTPEARTPSERTGARSPVILQRLGRLSAAAAELRAQLIPFLNVEPAATIPADGTAVEEVPQPSTSPPFQDLAERLDPATRAVLSEEGLDDTGGSVTALIARLDERANAIVIAALPERGIAQRRAAIAQEYVRRRGWNLGGLEPVSIDTTITPASSAHLLSPPVIGDLKVVRQTLRGYSFGEIAHVENVLLGERKERRHEIIDVREQETTETTEREEERAFDTQTTERNELAREVQSTLASDERFNVGATLEASYPPYVKLTATGGYAKATARTESTATSTRFARDVTERATTRLRERTEEVRRTLTRRTVTELNTHELNNLRGTGPVVGVYRWLNKEYCAQVLNYGRRVLLEIGVSDPSANYRYAVAMGSDLDVGVDPPPDLVSRAPPGRSSQ
jgi:hypothetical protein